MAYSALDLAYAANVFPLHFACGMVFVQRNVILQAPESMKSVVQAAWLLTTAIGDVIVVIVAGVKLFTQVSNYVIAVMSCLC